VKNCPVCGKTELSDIATACPQCNADLTCFAMLNVLYDKNLLPERPNTFNEIKEVQETLQRIHDKFERPVKTTRNRLVISIVIAMICMGSLLTYHYIFMKKWVDKVMISVEHRNQMYDKMYQSTAEQLSKTADELTRVSNQLLLLEKELSILAAENIHKEESPEKNVEQ